MNAPFKHNPLQVAVTTALQKGLSETVVETAKAQTYHWNVTGMAFQPLHLLFQQIYEDHFQAQDLLAERIKALGDHADGRLSHAVDRAQIDECDGKISASEMVARLAEDQNTLSLVFRELADLADQFNDSVTHDLAVARVGIHDQFGWMLRSHLD